MTIGIDAAKSRWRGNLVKKDFLHQAGSKDDPSATLAINYRGISFERASKAYHWSEHLHEGLEILFVKKGSYSGQLNGRAVKLGRGEALIIQQGDRHADICRPPLEYFALWFEIQQAADGKQVNLLRDGVSLDKRINSFSHGTILKRLEALFTEEQRDSRFSLSIRQVMAEEIVWRVLDGLPADTLNPRLVKQTQESELLFRITRLFEQDLSSPMTVREMAEALGMSESALAHACKDILGISPAKAFLHYRMNKAVNMLRSTNLSGKEIAAALGFHDESHFIHCFRREYGVTPGSFRKSESSQSQAAPLSVFD